MNEYILLFLAIISEVFGSSMLKISNGFRKILPILGFILGYGISFLFLAQSLNSLSLSVAYAIWAGVGTALTAIVGILIFKEHFNHKVLLGIFLIISGVSILHISN